MHDRCEGRRAWHLDWDLTALERGAQGFSFTYRTGNASSSRFPLRALRYWFMYQLILRESEARQRPLEGLELGTGEMMAFFNAAETDRCGLS